MGDPWTLGKKITDANRSRNSLWIICGSLITAIATFALMITWAGGDLRSFIDPATFIGVTGLSAAYGLLSCGGKPTLKVFLHGVRTGAIYSGVIVMVVGMIVLLSNISDPASFGAGLAMSIISVLYGIILSAGVRAAESWIAAPEPGAVKSLIE